MCYNFKGKSGSDYHSMKNSECIGVKEGKKVKKIIQRLSHILAKYSSPVFNVYNRFCVLYLQNFCICNKNV